LPYIWSVLLSSSTIPFDATSVLLFDPPVAATGGSGSGHPSPSASSSSASAVSGPAHDEAVEPGSAVNSVPSTPRRGSALGSGRLLHPEVVGTGSLLMLDRKSAPLSASASASASAAAATSASASHRLANSAAALQHPSPLTTHPLPSTQHVLLQYVPPSASGSTPPPPPPRSNALMFGDVEINLDDAIRGGSNQTLVLD
jgi:hypothetical protein